MVDQPRVEQDEDAYWRSSREFVRVLIAELNRVLNKQGVWKRKRRQICSEFAFEFAQFLDQRWMKVNGTTEYPLLCFVRTFLDLDVPLADVSPINAPHKSVELHAMVADEIRWFFDEMKERPDAVAIGDVGEETPDTGPTDEPVATKDLPCWTCQGTGQCFCLRKGPGTAEGCPRCGGTGRCRHCEGTGIGHPS